MARVPLALMVVVALTGCTGQGAQVEETTPAAAAEGVPAGAEPADGADEGPEAAAIPCREDEEDVEPGALATVAQSDRVWATLRGYLADTAGELAGTFDIPGDEHGLARLQSFRSVIRTEDGFATAAEFRSTAHTFEVSFDLRGQCDLEVGDGRLARIDGEPLVTETAAAETPAAETPTPETAAAPVTASM